jgi:hypothetical protein
VCEVPCKPSKNSALIYLSLSLLINAFFHHHYLLLNLIIPIFLFLALFPSMWAPLPIPPTALDFFSLQICVFLCAYWEPHICLPICCTWKPLGFKVILLYIESRNFVHDLENLWRDVGWVTPHSLSFHFVQGE